MIYVYGIITGILFGFLLQRARVIRYDKQVGALLLKDMTIVKFMFTAILVGMVGLYLLADLGMIEIAGRELILWAIIPGGALFGIGWALIGYCPGTGWAAIGEGRVDAIFGLLGVFVGGFIYSEMYPTLKDTLLSWGDLGTPTIPQALGINHWFVIVPILIVAFFMFRWMEKKGL
jgi:hypothetical protein